MTQGSPSRQGKRGPSGRNLQRNSTVLIAPHLPPTQDRHRHTPTLKSLPTLRANPFPKVTDLICRLPLLTLSYRQEVFNLGVLLRIRVRPGLVADCAFPSLSFKKEKKRETTTPAHARLFMDRQRGTERRRKNGALPKDMRKETEAQKKSNCHTTMPIHARLNLPVSG